MINFSQKHSKYFIGIILILALLFSFSFVAASALLSLFGLTEVNATVLFISRLFYWLCFFFLWLYSNKIEKGPFLIWQEKKYKISRNILSGFIIYAVLVAGTAIITKLLALAGFSAKSAAMDHLISIMTGNIALLIFTAATAGIVEELIFRGYIQPRLEIIFKNPYAAIIISSLFFGLLHYKYGTVLQVIGPIFIGMVFAFYYWKYKNIRVIIVCHFLWDLISLLLSKMH